MPEPRTISCEDCGADYETSRANARICARCRLLKDLLYIGARTKKCWICEATYAPLDRKDPACDSCSYQPKKHGITECAFCRKPALRVRSGVAICHRCARDPEQRALVIRALLKGQRRAKTNLEAVA